jgi:2-dehydropantoate 2-reductase
MMDKGLKIAVIGAGAIGGTTAAFLTKAGYDVELVCKYQSITDMANGGLKIVGVRGEHEVSVKSVKEIEDLSGVKDYIFVATKAYDMPNSCQKALAFANQNTLFLSMQNGISVDAMAQVVGKERTVGCVVGYGATMLAPGVLDMTSFGDFIIGMMADLAKNNEAKLTELKLILDHMVDTVVSDDIISALYSKLIVNSCITSLGAISGLYLGEMLKSVKARKIFLNIMYEAMDVATAMGIKVPPYGGKLDYYALTKTDVLSKIKAHIMIYLVGLKYKKLKSSSLQSLQRGKKTEIDFFNGYITSKASELGVQAKVNEAITNMVKEIENGTRKISVKNFDDERLNL